MTDIAKLECPDCDASYYYFGDFFGGHGTVVRAAKTKTHECERCTKIAEELGLICEVDSYDDD